MTTMIDTRLASTDDVDVLLADVTAGFASYVDFLPSGWRPPDMSAERGRTAELIADDATWALIALVDGQPSGHAAFLPARRRTPGAPADDSGRSRSPVDNGAHLRASPL